MPRQAGVLSESGYPHPERLTGINCGIVQKKKESTRAVPADSEELMEELK